VITAIVRGDLEILGLITAAVAVLGLLLVYLVTWSRRPAPRAAFGWRFLYPPVLIVLAVLAGSLVLRGSRLVLDSKDGSYAKIVQDPSLPGYFAQVAATPSLLIAQTRPVEVKGEVKNELVSVVVMSLSVNAANQDAGGWVMLFPAELIVPTPDGKTSALLNIFDQQGSSGVRTAIGRLLDADVDSEVLVRSESIAQLLAPVAPLRYTLPDAVKGTANGKAVSLPKGAVQVGEASEVAAATEVVNSGEASIARFGRQVDFWRAWIEAVRTAPDKATAFPASAEGTALVRFLRGLANGTTRIEQARFKEGVLSGDVLYVADVPALKSLALEMIPYPLPYEPGARIRVDVRNGVGNLALNEPMNRRLIAAGAQIVVLGNADAFDVPHTTVVYYAENMRDPAAVLAEAAGTTDVRFEERPDSSIDVTVTIGADFVP
jgi:hypothetical protein